MDRGSLSDVHRIVVKLGTHVVMRDGATLAEDRLTSLVQSVARLRSEGREVVLVSSGAVGMGMRVLGLKERPRSLGLRQACAAVGQSHLMQLYTTAFAERGVIAAQVLLTQEDLGDRDKALCVRTTLMRVLERGTVPVLNENDSVSVRELVEHNVRSGTATSTVPIFGDNDGLSALVAVALDADLVVLLTNVDGFFTASPSLDPNAQRISELSHIDESTLARALGSSSGGSGGMASKLEAARLAIAEGTAAVIANGTVPGILDRILAGDDVGTFVKTPAQRPRRLRHIAVSGRKQGALVVNAGALLALVDRKASLLPIGVVTVEGEFGAGDLVEIRDGSGRVHGRGLVNYDAASCRKLCGRHSDDIDALLGYRGYDALVTRDNLVMGSL